MCSKAVYASRQTACTFIDVSTGAHLWADRFDGALDEARVATASNALAGRLDRAKKPLARLLQIDPKLRASDLRQMLPHRRPEDIARYQEGLRKAGLRA